MQPTTQQRLTNLIRGGMAFTLATTLMVPTTALAEANAESVANTGGAQSEASNTDAGAQGSTTEPSGTEGATAGTDEATYVAAGAQGSEVDAAYEGEDGSPALDVADTADQVGDGDKKVTIIVQLEDGGTQGISLFSNLFGTQTQDRHAYFKNKVRELAKGETDENGGIFLDVTGSNHQQPGHR